MEHWVIDRHDGSHVIWTGSIFGHPGFVKLGKHRQGSKAHSAVVLVDTYECPAHRRDDIASETGLCSTSCKKAEPHTPCHCVCAGQNHGVDYDGIGAIETELELEA